MEKRRRPHPVQVSRAGIDKYAECVNDPTMKAILTDTEASAALLIDGAGGATLTDIARASGKAVSTIQRAVDALEAAGLTRRESHRGAIVFRPGAPRSAVRELARWTLGRRRSRELGAAAAALALKRPSIPRSITDPRIRDFWPLALDKIVEGFQPAQVILFGSQARGDAGPQSDVDLLVVFDKVGDRSEQRVQIRRALRDMPFAKDVLVATPEEVAHPAAGTAIAEAAREGLVVYER